MKYFPITLVCLLAACATPQTQPERPAEVAPRLTQHALVTQDGALLPYRQWLPRREPKVVIIALHGFNDYSHAFEIPGEYMQVRGVALLAYDQRGFGAAPGVGIWGGEDNFIRDASDMVTAVKKRYPHTPAYLLGESMGGAIAILAASQPGFPPVDGVILSAPAIWGGETMNPLFRMTLWGLAHTWPRKALTGEDLHILASDNIAMLRALGGDPLVIKGTRVDAIYGLVQLMDDGYRRIGDVREKMLILYGAHDQVVPPAPIVRGLRRVPAGTTVAYYPLGYHMLLRDLHGDVPVRDILSWMEDRNAPLPSGLDDKAKVFLKEPVIENDYPRLKR